MADYWKSQPRKFCQYCKCWIADNKPSVDFHERGKNHKENVAAKISEIKKKSVQKAKQDERMGKQFAAMEEAAMKAYEEDLKRMGREAAFGPGAETTSTAFTTSTYQPVPTVQPPKQPLSSKEESQPKKPQKKGPQPGPKPAPPSQQPPPVQVPHPVPLPQHPLPVHPQHTQLIKHPQKPQQPRKSQQPLLPPGVDLWQEGKSDEGYTYYYNTITGESRWDKPEELKVEAPQAASAESTENSTKGVWMEAVSPEGYTYYYHTVTGESSWEKPADFTPKDATESSEKGEDQEDTEEAQETDEKEEASSEQTGTTEQGSQPSTVPKIQFRKRKAEADSSEETSTAEGAQKESEDAEEEETESEMKEEEKEDETPTGRFRPPNPYGTWERVKVQKDPYKNVDWQLPQVQSVEETAAVDLPPEPKHKFKTRVITSLGDSASSTGPVTFKKKKTQNGKSRSLRQRDEDD